MDDRVGLTPIPTDANIEEFLQDSYKHDLSLLSAIVSDLVQTIEQTRESGEPDIFAYGKLLSYLRSEQHWSEPLRIKVMAAAIWELAFAVWELANEEP